MNEKKSLTPEWKLKLDGTKKYLYNHLHFKEIVYKIIIYYLLVKVKYFTLNNLIMEVDK